MAHIDDRWKGGHRSRKRWRARYVGADRRERSRSFDRRTAAERWLAAQETSKARGEWIDPALGQITVAAWLWQWLESVRSTLKPKTADSDESMIRARIEPGLGTVQLAHLRLSDVQAFVGWLQKERGLSPSSVRKTYVILAEALDAAIHDGRIGRNVARGAKLPRIEQSEAPFFEPEVVDRIIDAVPEQYRALVRLLGTLGPRFGEAVALRGRHLDALRRRLRIEESIGEVAGRLVTTSTKTHAARMIPLPRSLADELAALGRGPDEYLFTAPQRGPVRYRNFEERAWKPTLKRLRLPAVGLHVLRHSAAARMIALGAKPKEFQMILGHRSAAFTLTVYGHVFDTDLDALADRLDGAGAVLSRPQEGTGDLHVVGEDA